MQQRGRTIQTSSSCGGTACIQSQLQNTKTCKQYVNVDCRMSAWSAWAKCSSGCGVGTSQRTRSVLQQSMCNGIKCGSVIQSNTCTSYRDRTDCQVNSYTVKSYIICDYEVNSYVIMRLNSGLSLNLSVHV